ncbi:hypothetical protein SAMN06296386_104256 [Lachnospiraceae bacterium]|nr:hypothetical protein SAMN06296386_104256 [Lachnospiraceae bacterium]
MIFQLKHPSSSNFQSNDADKELKYLLDYNSFTYEGSGGHYSLQFRDHGLVWNTEFQVIGDRVMIWGMYPFSCMNEARGNEFCNSVNLQTVMGAFVMYKAHLTYRTSADLFDAFSSTECLARAIEYNANAVVHFWDRASKASNCR